MGALYIITDWATHFETDETRKRDSLRWVPIPNKHDGLGFRTLAAQRNAGELYAAWILLLQIASKGKRGERGVLTRGGHALTAEDMAAMTGFPKDGFDRALKFLSQPKLNWISEGTHPDASAGSAVGASSNGTSDSPAQSAGVPALNAVRPADDAGPPARREGKGIEGKEGNGADALATPAASPREIMKRWNETTLPKAQELTDGRRTAANARLKERFFIENWQAALARISTSEFCRGERGRGWKADFDWFLKPGTVVSAMEGKYDNQTSANANGHVPVKRLPSAADHGY